MTERLNDRRLTTTDGLGKAGLALALVLLAGTASAVAQSQFPEDEPVEGGLADMIADASQEPDVPEPAIRDPLGNSAAKLEGAVKVDENLIVDLHVNDEDLRTVLQMLSLQSQRNIVTSPQVSATVTANLYGVTFFEALDAILHINGYGYIEQGNFIYVYTREELAQIEQASRVRVAKVVKLNYLSSTDAAEFVKPLLSEGGQIKTNGKAEEFSLSDTAPVGGEDFAHTSTLVVYDYEENVTEIDNLLRTLDTRPAQVLVEATILQSSLTDTNAFGVDFAVVSDLDFADFINGGPLSIVDSLINGQGARLNGSSEQPVNAPGGDGSGDGIVSSPGNTAGPATFKVGIVNDDVAVFLRLLDEVTDTTILSNPKVLTLNRQPARVLVGRKVGYLNTTSTETATTQTVEFLDTGTQLSFRPFVGEDGFIRLELKPQVSEAVIRNATQVGGTQVTIPDEITNELTTNVMVRDGQTVVLGGLFRESTTATRRQVPVVGDIPIIGAAFRGHEDETERSEIIFMIKPSIVNDQVLTEQAERGTELVERVRTGAREGVLPFARERLSAQLNVEAERLAAEGNYDKALWKTRQSLALNPIQPEAQALRDRLSGKQSTWPSRSMLDEIVNGETQNLTNSIPEGAGNYDEEEAEEEKSSNAGNTYDDFVPSNGAAFADEQIEYYNEPPAQNDTQAFVDQNFDAGDDFQAPASQTFQDDAGATDAPANDPWHNAPSQPDEDFNYDQPFHDADPSGENSDLNNGSFDDADMIPWEQEPQGGFSGAASAGLYGFGLAEFRLAIDATPGAKVASATPVRTRAGR